jgi:Glycosyl transferases group 1
MKQYAVISCPIDTYSGYGARSRDFVKALYELKKDEWEIEILPQRWGSTPWGYIADNQEEWGWIVSLLNSTGQLKRQPDFWCQITVPNEFQPIGKYNLGLTAGIETTMCHASWIDGVNRMNLTLVSSQHAKNVLEQTVFQEKNPQGQITRSVKLEKPVDVLFEGADLNKYFFIEDEKIPDTDLVSYLDQIKEDFCYLVVGHWLQGEFGEDRKNIGLTIKMFLDTFKNKKNKPAMVLKISGGGASIMDRDSILEKIDKIRSSIDSKDLPNLYLIHGEMDDEDMNYLYNHGKIKAMISLTKGEGFGRPLLEFSLSKKPIIVSAYSGHTDFLFMENVCMVGGQITQIHPSAVVENLLIAESGWFSVDIKQAEFYLQDVFNKYGKYQERAKQQAYKSKTMFSFEEMKKLLGTYLDKVPKQVGLKLPTLKKIELPKLKKVE